jgi:hypothetical protein
LKSCKKDCVEEYFSFIDKNLEIPKEKEYVLIYRIGARNLPEFQYIFEAKYSFIIYMSNIGGIVSLWFGLAVIDINIIIKRIFIIIKMYSIQYMRFDYLLQVMKTTRILKYLSKLVEFTILFINGMDSFNFKLMAKLICFPCFVYQVIELTNIYLDFSTIVSIELIPIVNKSLISIENIPAMTICHENKLGKNFFSPEKLIEIENHIQKFNLNYSVNSKIESTEYLNETNKKILSFYEYLLRKTNPYLYKEILEFLIKYVQNLNDEKLFANTFPSNDEMKFYSNHFDCDVGIDRMLKCQNFSQVVASFSSLGKCNTFRIKNENYSEFQPKHRLRSEESLLFLSKADLNPAEYMKNKLYIHSSDSMPSHSNYDWSGSEFRYNRLVLFSEYMFRKLESPYDTNCRKYGQKSRSDCLNDCLIENLNSSKNCINNKEILIMFKIYANRTEPDIAFCSEDYSKNNNFSTVSLKQCYEKCRVSCDERLFIVEFSQNTVLKPYRHIGIVELDFYKNYYLNIIYAPNMLFMQYIIGVANLMGLWHGIDFLSLIDQFFQIIGLFLTKIRVKNFFNKIFQLLINYGNLRIFFIFTMKIFRVVAKKSQVLFIHILLGFHFFKEVFFFIS